MLELLSGDLNCFDFSIFPGAEHPNPARTRPQVCESFAVQMRDFCFLEGKYLYVKSRVRETSCS